MNSVLLVILVIFSVYRVTRILTIDFVTEPLRDRIETRFGDDHWITYLSGCMWCMSVWVGAVLVGVTSVVTSMPYPVLVWLVSSSGAGLLHTWAESQTARAALAEAEIEMVKAQVRARRTSPGSTPDNRSSGGYGVPH